MEMGMGWDEVMTIFLWFFFITLMRMGMIEQQRCSLPLATAETKRQT